MAKPSQLSILSVSALFRNRSNKYTETQELLGSSFSACGDSVNMRVNASMVAKGKGTASVDSLDVAHKGTVASIPPHLIYHLKYQACPAK
jgi:hypothetical protein